MPATCSVRGCKRPHHANGYCHPHNMRRVHGWDTSTPVRTIRRLSDLDAQIIRGRYVGRHRPTILELAEEYRVSRVTIWRALRGWSHPIDDGLQDAIEARARENEHPRAPRSADEDLLRS